MHVSYFAINSCVIVWLIVIVIATGSFLFIINEPSFLIIWQSEVVIRMPQKLHNMINISPKKLVLQREA